MLTNIATVIVYVIVLSIIKKRGADGVTKKIIRSLTWIVAVVTGSWFVTVTIITVMSRFTSLSPPQQAIGIIYSGVFINFGCSCNFLILYKCSSEYRQQLRKQLRAMICCRLLISTDATVSSTSSNNWLNDSRGQIGRYDISPS
ncbi:SRSX-32 protein [Aphelenchoides avenae]|nr:SRSX-32 protein [Aphelenchus avenae]